MLGDGPGMLGDGPGILGDGPGILGEGPGILGEGPGVLGLNGLDGLADELALGLAELEPLGERSQRQYLARLVMKSSG